MYYDEESGSSGFLAGLLLGALLGAGAALLAATERGAGTRRRLVRVVRPGGRSPGDDELESELEAAVRAGRRRARR